MHRLIIVYYYLHHRRSILAHRRRRSSPGARFNSTYIFFTQDNGLVTVSLSFCSCKYISSKIELFCSLGLFLRKGRKTKILLVQFRVSRFTR